jgi:uncharacterized membrane protein YgdD (TMEM256/DUF423 family)
MTDRGLTTFAALSAAMAIAAGAFGAHSVSGLASDLLKTGCFYQIVHSIAALHLIAPRGNRPVMLMLAGASIFAVSLYLMALGAPRWLGAITPIGGVAMIGAWLWIAARAAWPKPDQ